MYTNFIPFSPPQNISVPISSFCLNSLLLPLISILKSKQKSFSLKFSSDCLEISSSFNFTLFFLKS